MDHKGSSHDTGAREPTAPDTPMQSALPRIFAALALSLSIACGIPEEEHRAALRDAEDLKLAVSAAQRESAERSKRNAELEELFEEQKKRADDLDARHTSLQTRLETVEAELEFYARTKGDLEQALNASQAELDQLRRARVAAEERAEQYRRLTERLAAMMRSGKLKVSIRNGKMIIELPNNVLFAPGSATLRDDGLTTLDEVADVLENFDRNFLVAGHTDNVPISGKRFASNWALSTARAVEVVAYLQKQGVQPEKLAAAGYGEFDPVAPNDTEEGQAKNRRIEIVLMPALDELPAIPELNDPS